MKILKTTELKVEKVCPATLSASGEFFFDRLVFENRFNNFSSSHPTLHEVIKAAQLDSKRAFLKNDFAKVRI